MIAINEDSSKNRASSDVETNGKSSPIQNVVVSTYFEEDEIERIRAEVNRRGLHLIYHPEWLVPAAFPAQHIHSVKLNPSQEAQWLADLKVADIMLDFETLTLNRWVSENLVPRLRWLQSTSAGVGPTIVQAGIKPDSGIIVTTASGVHAKSLAEHVLMVLLMWVKKYRELAAPQQVEHVWKQYSTDELNGKTLAIVGAGKIGREIARLARAFDMHVLAAPSHTEGRNAADYFADELFSTSDKKDFHAALARSDAVVLVTPLTPATQGMIGQSELSAMKQGAYLINIARGGVIADEQQLIDALASGKLSGAALDVFKTEPLPSDNPLWSMPNVVITPHSSSTVLKENSRIIDLFLSNLDLFLAGEYSKMRNILDLERLY